MDVLRGSLASAVLLLLLLFAVVGEHEPVEAAPDIELGRMHGIYYRARGKSIYLQSKEYSPVMLVLNIPTVSLCTI